MSEKVGIIGGSAPTSKPKITEDWIHRMQGMSNRIYDVEQSLKEASRRINGERPSAATDSAENQSEPNGTIEHIDYMFSQLSIALDRLEGAALDFKNL